MHIIKNIYTFTAHLKSKKMKNEKVEFKNVTPQQLVEFFGGELKEENGTKTYVVPREPKVHRDFTYEIQLKNGTLSVIQKSKI